MRKIYTISGDTIAFATTPKLTEQNYTYNDEEEVLFIAFTNLKNKSEQYIFYAIQDELSEQPYIIMPAENTINMNGWYCFRFFVKNITTQDIFAISDYDIIYFEKGVTKIDV